MTAPEQPDTEQPAADPNDAYPTGAARQDPDTKAVAVRQTARMPSPWAVMTVGQGGHFADPYEVDRILTSWVDLKPADEPPDAADA